MLKAGLWYIAGSFALRGLTFVSLLIFSRLLPPDQFGLVSIYLLWVNLFSIIATLYAEAAVARTKFDLSWDEFKKFVSSTMFLGVVSGTIVLIVFAILPAGWIEPFFTLPKPLILLATGTGILFMAFRVTIVIWEMTYNYKRNVPMTLAIEVMSIALSVLLVLLSINGNTHYEASFGRIAGYSFVYGLTGACLLAYHMWVGKTFIKPNFWWLAVSYTLPILPHVIASSLLAGYDRILISQYDGRTATGIYAFAYQLGGTSTLIWAAMNNAWSPWYFDNMKQNKLAIVRSRTRQFMYLYAGIIVALIIISPLLVKLTASPAYMGASRIVPIVMACGFFNLLYGFYSNIELLERKTIYVSIATIVAAAINIGLNIVLIPQYGYIAAAWTTLGGYFCLFVFHAAIVRFTSMRELDTNNLLEDILLGAGIVALVLVVDQVQLVVIPLL